MFLAINAVFQPHPQIPPNVEILFNFPHNDVLPRVHTIEISNSPTSFFIDIRIFCLSILNSTIAGFQINLKKIMNALC